MKFSSLSRRKYGIPQVQNTTTLQRIYGILVVFIVCFIFSFIFGGGNDEYSVDMLRSTSSKEYVPASSEVYLIDNAVRLGYESKEWTKGCGIWNDKAVAPEIYDDLHTLLEELEDYNKRLDALEPIKVDNRIRLQKDPVNACKALRLHPKGLLNGIFKKSKQLSWTAKAGYVEPLFSPMRHPGSLCFTPHTKELLDMSYMVHDFEHLCQQLQTKPVPGMKTVTGETASYTPKTVLLDMGAALDFHKDKTQKSIPPPIQFYNMWRNLGFYFDHIFAFEMKEKKPTEVFQALSPEYMSSFHWINIGVDANVTSRANALYNILLPDYKPEDFVVVKLDIDTSFVEMALINEMIDDVRFHSLIDIFYFEHHVKLEELAWAWGKTSEGSIKESLDLFYKLRKLGIPAHFWI